MKTYIITENQLNKILDEKTKSITKGIGLKISGQNGEYYKSVIKSFSDEKEFKHWKDNLDENTKIIGVMDIESEPKEVVKESVDFNNKKKKIVIKTITNSLKKKYPFVLEIIPKKNRGTAIDFDVVFDLNKFYDITNTTYSPSYVGKDYLLKLLKEPGLYLMRYVDNKYNEMFDYKFNTEVQSFVTKINSALPSDMRFLKFEDFTKGELEDFKNYVDTNRDISFYEKWKDDKEPMDFHLNEWIPKVDLSKLESLKISEEKNRLDEKIDFSRFRRIQELRDAIEHQTHIVDPCEFEDGEEYASFCINEGISFFFGDTNYESEEGSVYMSDYSGKERQKLENIMMEEYFFRLKNFWKENFKDDCI